MWRPGENLRASPSTRPIEVKAIVEPVRRATAATERRRSCWGGRFVDDCATVRAAGSFGGDSSKGFVRIKLLVSWAMFTNCYDALTAEVPVKLGGGKSVVELERTHSKADITKALTLLF